MVSWSHLPSSLTRAIHDCSLRATSKPQNPIRLLSAWGSRASRNRAGRRLLNGAQRKYVNGTELGDCLVPLNSVPPNSAHPVAKREHPCAPCHRGAVEQAGRNHFEILIYIFGLFRWQRNPFPGNEVPSRELLCREEHWRRSRTAGLGWHPGPGHAGICSSRRLRTWGTDRHFSSSDYSLLT